MTKVFMEFIYIFINKKTEIILSLFWKHGLRFVSPELVTKIILKLNL